MWLLLKAFGFGLIITTSLFAGMIGFLALMRWLLSNYDSGLVLLGIGFVALTIMITAARFVDLISLTERKIKQ